MQAANSRFTKMLDSSRIRVSVRWPWKENEHIIRDVADQIATRYGILPRDITHAALQTIVLTTADGIDALDEVHRWLQRVGIPDTHAIHQAPRQRWEQLLRNLFPASIIVVDPHGSASPDLVTVPVADDAGERAVRRLLRATAAFLTAETTALEDSVDLSQHWTSSDQNGADEVPDALDEILRRATRASRTLLDHAESGQWRNLLASYAPPTAASATPASTATAAPSRDGRRTQNMTNSGRPVFGIDLGTTYSAIAYVDETEIAYVDETEHPTVSRNTDRLETMPSVLYFEANTSVALESTAQPPDGNRRMRRTDISAPRTHQSTSPMEQRRRVRRSLGDFRLLHSMLTLPCDYEHTELVHCYPWSEVGELLLALVKLRDLVPDAVTQCVPEDLQRTFALTRFPDCVSRVAELTPWFPPRVAWLWATARQRHYTLDPLVSRSIERGWGASMRIYQPMLFVGLGGTGCKVGAELERRLREELCNPAGTRPYAPLTARRVLIDVGFTDTRSDWYIPCLNGPDRIVRDHRVSRLNEYMVPRAESRMAASGDESRSNDSERLWRLSDVMDHAGQDLDVTLTRIVQTAVELSDASYGALRVVGSDDQLLDEFVCDGDDGQRLGGQVENPYLIRDPIQRAARRVLDEPIYVQGRVFGHLHLAEPHGGSEFDEGTETMVKVLVAVAAAAVDNARLREEALLRERFMEASAEVNARLTEGGSSSQAALTLIACRIRELVNADWALLVLSDGVPPSEMVIHAADGKGSSTLLGATIAIDEPLIARILETQKSESIPDVSTLLPREWRAAGEEFGPAVAVPLHAGQGVSGVLLAMRRRGGPSFPRDHLPLLASFANQAALALELAEKHRAQRQLDVLADRDRIAADLHDHVIQRLYATGMSLQGLVRRIVDPTVRRRVNRAVEQLDETVREIRTSIFDLHTTGTAAALVSLRRRLLDVVEELTADTDVSPSVRIAGTVDTLVPEDLAAHATAVLHEAVRNAVLHANASSIVVTVEAGADLIIDVVDDGVGMPAAVTRGGLLAVERRAVKCGGQSVVVPGPDGGTRLTWRAPLTNTNQSDNVIRLFDREDAARGGPENQQYAASDGGRLVASQSGHQVIQWTAVGQ